MMLTPKSGCALVSRRDGTIERIIFDSLRLADGLAPGATLQSMADAHSRDRMDAFLAEIAANHAGFNCEVGIAHGDVSIPLHLSGALIADGILILAAQSRHAKDRIEDELVRINSEQTNQLRTTTKDLALATRAGNRGDEQLLNDLSRVNNELANLQRDLARKNVELDRLNVQKNRLLGMAAHDLRSPLGVILTYGEFLQTEAILTDEQRDFVATIRQTSEFMLRVIDDLLDVSQIEAGRLELSLHPADLVGLVRTRVAFNAVLSSRKRIALEADAAIDTLVVPLDEVRISQVLNNLIGNAVKFSQPDSRVCVRVVDGAEQATVEVLDQGLGMTADAMASLFQPFSESSTLGTAGERGVGLGLAIVRRIVEAHGGTLEVDSVEGRGSTFRFGLPKTRQNAEP